MARRFVRVDLSAGARNFLPIAVEPGVPLLDNAGTNAKILFRWLGELAADPELDGDSVNFHVLDAEGGRLEEVACEPATEQDLDGPLLGDLELLRERIEAVKPETTTERALLKILKETFESHVAEESGLERSFHFFKYRNALDRWRLVWCWGFRRRDRDAGQTSVCGHSACNLLFVRREGERTECPDCEAVLQAAPLEQRAPWKRGLLVGLLLLVVAAVLMHWIGDRNRSTTARVTVPPERNPSEIPASAPAVPVDEASIQSRPPGTERPVVDETPVNELPPGTQRPVVDETPVNAMPPDTKPPVVDETPINAMPPDTKPPIVDETPVNAMPPDTKPPVVDETPVNALPPDTEPPIVDETPVNSLPPETGRPVEVIVIDADSPVNESPVTDDPVTDGSMPDDSIADDPVTDDPATDDPVTADPIPDNPVTDVPMPDVPMTDNPVTDRPETSSADEVVISISPAEVSLRVGESSPPFTVVTHGEQGDESPAVATLQSLDPEILAPVDSRSGRFVARSLGQTQVRAVYRGQEAFAKVTVTGDRFSEVRTSLTSGEDDFSVTIEVLAAKSEGPLEYRVFESGSAPPEVWVPSRTHKEAQRVELTSDPIPYRSRRARYTLIIEARASGGGSLERYPLTFRLEPRIVFEH